MDRVPTFSVKSQPALVKPSRCRHIPGVKYDAQIDDPTVTSRDLRQLVAVRVPPGPGPHGAVACDQHISVSGLYGRRQRVAVMVDLDDRIADSHTVLIE